MNAKEFLEEQAASYKFTVIKSSDDDFDLRPNPALSKVAHPNASIPSASDLIQLVAVLQEAEYSLTFFKDNSIHVHAPHRKEHDWGNRGWECTHGLTVKGCEVFRKGASDSEKLRAGLRGRQMAR